jgi:hypothetical protein
MLYYRSPACGSIIILQELLALLCGVGDWKSVQGDLQGEPRQHRQRAGQSYIDSRFYFGHIIVHINCPVGPRR